MHSEKIPFYTTNIIKDLIPRVLFRRNIHRLLDNVSEFQRDYIDYRVNYYNKLSSPFILDESAVECGRLTVRGHPSSYYYDLMESARYFDPYLRFNYFLGDIRHVPDKPTLLKTRPIAGDNQNSVLLKLNKIRHFRLFNDRIPFEQKRNMAVFRGACYQPARKQLLDNYQHSPLVDVADTGRYDGVKRKNLMCETEQMKYKFIISIEGNDVATNLKWIMHSNSLCFMRKPKVESWFLEGSLVPDFHYVLLKDDFSDLEEKIEYYSHHIDEAKMIINNANHYVAQFLDDVQERVISLLVMKKYFALSGQ